MNVQCAHCQTAIALPPGPLGAQGVRCPRCGREVAPTAASGSEFGGSNKTSMLTPEALSAALGQRGEALPSAPPARRPSPLGNKTAMFTPAALASALEGGVPRAPAAPEPSSKAGGAPGPVVAALADDPWSSNPSSFFQIDAGGEPAVLPGSAPLAGAPKPPSVPSPPNGVGPAMPNIKTATARGDEAEAHSAILPAQTFFEAAPDEKSTKVLPPRDALSQRRRRLAPYIVGCAVLALGGGLAYNLFGSGALAVLHRPAALQLRIDNRGTGPKIVAARAVRRQLAGGHVALMVSGELESEVSGQAAEVELRDHEGRIVGQASAPVGLQLAPEDSVDAASYQAAVAHWQQEPSPHAPGRTFGVVLFDPPETGTTQSVHLLPQAGR